MMSIGRVVKSKELSPQTVNGVGIALYTGLAHVGLLYRVSEQQSVEILHLAWNRDLRSQAPTDKCAYWVRPEIEPDRAAAIAALCRRIWKNNSEKQITFSFTRPSGFFDFDGNQIKGPAKAGLTCAAFVLAVFDAAKFPLVIESDWPTPTKEDIDQQQDFLKILREQTENATEEDIKQCEAECGNIRFRPLEVAGAGTADEFPATYEFAKDMAIKIKEWATKPLPPPNPQVAV